MKVLVLGKGFLGKAFERKGIEVWGRDKLDLAPGGVDDIALGIFYGYNAIINCIGKSNTRWCEDNFHEALWCNGDVPRVMSEWCEFMGKQFVHVSTGCLYDSGEYAYKEDALLTAHCNYTVTKWVGEQGLCKADLVVRPRLLFGSHKDKNNLLGKLPNFSHYTVEQNSFTSVDVLVDAIMALLSHKQHGVFNVACDGTASVLHVAAMCGLTGVPISEDELHQREGLFLVNNIMHLGKLRKFYKPPRLKSEVVRCWKELH